MRRLAAPIKRDAMPISSHNPQANRLNTPVGTTLAPVLAVLATLLVSTFSFAQTPAAALTPDAAIAEALHTSPMARAARFSRDSALAKSGHDRPSALPTITGTVSGGVQGPRVTYPAPTNGIDTVLPNEIGRVDINLEQPLYHAGGKAAQKRYETELSLAQLDYRKSLSEIAGNIRKLCLDLQRARSGIRIAEAGVVTATSFQQLVEKTIIAGLGKPIDRQSAAAQVAEAQSGLSQAKSGEKLAIMAINQAIGRKIDSALPLQPYVAERTERERDTIEPADTLEAALNSAVKQRHEILALEIGIEAAKAGILLARSQTSPSLVARGQLTEQTPSAFVHEHYAAALIELKLPILDGGKARLDKREAEAELNRLQALLEETRSGIALDVRRAWERIQEAHSRIALCLLQRDNMRATLNVAETTYGVGRATSIEVQSARREVTLAEERLLQADFDLLLARFEFNQAAGTAEPAVDALAPLTSPSVQKR